MYKILYDPVLFTMINIVQVKIKCLVHFLKVHLYYRIPIFCYSLVCSIYTSTDFWFVSVFSILPLIFSSWSFLFSLITESEYNNLFSYCYCDSLLFLFAGALYTWELVCLSASLDWLPVLQLVSLVMQVCEEQHSSHVFSSA